LFSTIDRYVLREVAWSLGGVTSVLLAILVSYQLARILGTAAERGFPHEIVFALIGLTTLENLMILVPIAVLLGVMLALGRLYHESEMTAVRASGVGPERLYRPVFALALPIAIVLGWLAFVVGPAARDGAEQLRGRGLRDAQFGMLEPGKFRIYADGQAVFYAEQLGADGRLENVFVQRLAGDRVEVATAAWAEHRALHGGQTQLVVLHDGERIEGVPGQASFRRIRFVEHGIPVVVPAAGGGRVGPERKPTAELLASSQPADIAELQRRLSMPVMVLVLAVIAVPLAAVRPREGRYARVAIAVLIYFFYSNLLSAAQVWIQKGQLPPEVGTWWVHALAAALGLALLLRQSPASGWRRQARAA
jgi:lipopolysaccharide export system permease protein